jgi:type I restriction-modification system DNA methylase subunit
MSRSGTTQVGDFIVGVESLYSTGLAREHAYRPLLAKLFEQFPDVLPINDPAKSEHGFPDFVFLRKSNNDITIGYGEAKDIGIDLDGELGSEQMARYKNYTNLILTNGLEFIFFRSGEIVSRVKIASLSGPKVAPAPQNYELLVASLDSLFSSKPEKVKSAAVLARVMANAARLIRAEVKRLINRESPQLSGIFRYIKSELVHDLDDSTFSDMYAQTLVYGLFAARHADKSPGDFTRYEARDLIPESNPFLRVFFDHIAGQAFEKDLAYVVNEFCEVLAISDIGSLLDEEVDVEKLSLRDPIIHFYEDFLAQYDPELRRKFGAYYTPLPIADYLISQVDEILKSHFDIVDGLLDSTESDKSITMTSQGKSYKQKFKKVQILDPATGTGTFLNQIILKIAKQFEGNEGAFAPYATQHLLPRIHGFELLMAPYTVAHLKLTHTLNHLGVFPTERLHLYLTNTLDKAEFQEPDLFQALGIGAAISLEASLAGEVKNTLPVMVVIGNPPYSGVSSNKNRFADGLITKYKFEPGSTIPLKERKHRLDDDYVKFIAYSEDLILKNGFGIVAFIVNHGFIDNASYRGMRWHLLNTFDEIRIIDLHGNVVKRATGSIKDENVFSIKQGVALFIAIRKPNRKNKSAMGEVYFTELIGTRDEKFIALTKGPELTSIAPRGPLYNFTGEASDHRYITIDALFDLKTSGIQTSRDDFAVGTNRAVLEGRIVRFGSSSLSDEEALREFFPNAKPGKYPAGDSRQWSLISARALARELPAESLSEPYLYRPFDIRFLANSEVFVDWPRTKVMRNVLPGKPALIVGREGKAVGGEDWNLAFVSDLPSDLNIFYRGGGQVMPLYQETPSGWISNLNFESVSTLLEGCGLKFNPELVGPEITQKECGPDAVFAYLYGCISSTSYRKAYHNDLRIGFPPIQSPESLLEFTSIMKFGIELLDLHLPSRQGKNPAESPASFSVSGNNFVEAVRRSGNQVFINEGQYFDNISSEVWGYSIGGYVPAQKFLLDRQGKELDYDELLGYLMLVKAISQTLEAIERFERTLIKRAD